ncbi:hypothetical protein D9756_003163 [Leucocoprinus leucothites]|uniref:O-methyltransferase domain-containing protein n=1 Tax=Leucocoprinus leucothites TaxID=201217 RepID=A0A8H5G720_9AGAR|nr:hypothetical protein D9756_003163 [Leucoagaricus leucothites]
MAQDPVSIAEDLLRLVKKVYPGKDNLVNQQLNPFEAYEAKYEIEDRCGLLLRTVLGPLGYTTLLAESCQESSALGFVTELGVADFLEDRIMTVDKIAEELGVKTKFLKVALSCVTKHGYFEEIDAHSASPAYRNNDLSSILRKDHPTSLKDSIGFMCDDGLRATSFLLPAAKVDAPKTTQGKEAPAISLAFGFEESVFSWLAKDPIRGKRMGSAMEQLHRVTNENTAFDYDWPTLASPVVDVGGGIGSLEMILLRNQRQGSLNFIVFDIAATIENARKEWEKIPASKDFSISFQAGDFMAPKFEDTLIPAGKPTYIIRHVLHNWSDEEVVHILGHVRTAMSSNFAANRTVQPKLLLCETLLLPDSNRWVRAASMQIMAMSSGWTRTEADMIRLLEAAGFLYIKSHRMRADDTIVEATLPA